MKEYFYEVDFNWKGDKKGEITSPGLSLIEVSFPLTFRSGQKNHWTAEHLLTGAASASLMYTFMNYAEAASLIILDYQSQGFIKLEENNGNYRPLEILLRPKVKIENEKDLSQAIMLMEKSEQNFPVRPTLNIGIQVHPLFEFGSKSKSRKIRAGI